jgi:glycosyltransferase involved in cell wall biosynthesis
MTDAPVSVIVAVRDGGRYIGAAIDSILAQTQPPQEVWIVDDGSVDDTASVVSGYGPPVTYVAAERLGRSSALNRGLTEAGCGLVAFLDADDLWEPDKLELQLAALDRDPELDLVFCHAEQFHSPELNEEERGRIRLTRRRLPAIAKTAMLAKRSAFDAVGGFDERSTVTDFVDWYARAQDAGLRSKVLPEVLVSRRLHPANSGRRADQAEYARALAVVLQRRRAAEGAARDNEAHH